MELSGGNRQVIKARPEGRAVVRRLLQEINGLSPTGRIQTNKIVDEIRNKLLHYYAVNPP